MNSVPTDTRTAQGNKTGLSNFDSYLDKHLTNTTEQIVTANQLDKPVSFGTVNSKVDEEDERAAIKELLELHKMLILGKIDISALNNTDTNPDMADGPNRKTLETLKTVLRRLLGVQGAADNNNMDNFSVRELIRSLPDGMKDLLKRFFPDLEEMLLKDEKNLADQSIK